MVKNICGIYEFPRDDKVWQVVALAGVAGNPNVNSEPSIEVLMTSSGRSDPLHGSFGVSPGLDFFRTKVGVGQLPYVAIGSCWKSQRPAPRKVQTAEEVSVTLDSRHVRFLALGDLIKQHHALPRSVFPLGRGYAAAAGTQFAVIEQNGNPFALIIPVIEIIRFYFASSTRLAQAFFWGEFAASYNAERSGFQADGSFKLHLRRWMYDDDSWTLARYHCDKAMRREANRCFRTIQAHSVNSTSGYRHPFSEYQCGFPFDGLTALKTSAIVFSNPQNGKRSIFVLEILECSASFPFESLSCDRDNKNWKDRASLGLDLPHAWVKRSIEEVDDDENERKDNDQFFHSDQEPTNSLEPLVYRLDGSRFLALRGKVLQKLRGESQQYKGSGREVVERRNLDGYSTGHGTSGKSDRRPAVINSQNAPVVPQSKPSVPASFTTFFQAVIEVAQKLPCVKANYISVNAKAVDLESHPCTLAFPTTDPGNSRRRMSWAKIKAKDGWRARRIAIAEISTGTGERRCYVAEAERRDPGEKRSMLVFCRRDFGPLTHAEVTSFLLASAVKGRWMSKEDMKAYHRKTVTHHGLTSSSVLAGRMRKSVVCILGLEIDLNLSMQGPASAIDRAPEAAADEEVTDSIFD